MPLLGTRGAASVRGFGFANSTKETWSGYKFTTSTTGTYLQPIITADNSYIYSVLSQSGNTYVVKSTFAGSIIWQKQLTASSGSFGAYCIDVDSSGNIYIGGGRFPSSYAYAVLIKLDSSGNISWTRYWSDGNDAQGAIFGISARNYSNVVTYGGAISSDGYYKGHLSWFNSSGTNLAIKYVASPTNYITVHKPVYQDSSGNVYVAGMNWFSPNTEAIITKWNTSYNLVWSRSLTSSSGGAPYTYAITADSSGNVYVGGQDGSIWTVKYNSSGTFQWQKYFTLSGRHLAFTTDSSGNLYSAVRAQAQNGIYIGKFSPSDGSTIWVKKVVDVAADNLPSIVIVGSNVLASGWSQTNTPSFNAYGFVPSLPISGSLSSGTALNNTLSDVTLTGSSGLISSSTNTNNANYFGSLFADSFTSTTTTAITLNYAVAT